jgi:dTDP-4-amino-4,6-dideoxygalactose transaminase
VLTAICRYGPRVIPETDAIVKECRARGELIQGPHIARFERAFAAHLGVDDTVAASYGRMAFFYILKALEFPPGSEVISIPPRSSAPSRIGRSPSCRPTCTDCRATWMRS